MVNVRTLVVLAGLGAYAARKLREVGAPEQGALDRTGSESREALPAAPDTAAPATSGSAGQVEASLGDGGAFGPGVRMPDSADGDATVDWAWNVREVSAGVDDSGGEPEVIGPASDAIGVAARPDEVDADPVDWSFVVDSVSRAAPAEDREAAPEAPSEADADAERGDLHAKREPQAEPAAAPEAAAEQAAQPELGPELPRDAVSGQAVETSDAEQATEVAAAASDVTAGAVSLTEASPASADVGGWPVPAGLVVDEATAAGDSGPDDAQVAELSADTDRTDVPAAADDRDRASSVPSAFAPDPEPAEDGPSSPGTAGGGWELSQEALHEAIETPIVIESPDEVRRYEMDTASRFMSGLAADIQAAWWREGPPELEPEHSSVPRYQEEAEAILGGLPTGSSTSATPDAAAAGETSSPVLGDDASDLIVGAAIPAPAGSDVASVEAAEPELGDPAEAEPAPWWRLPPRDEPAVSVRAQPVPQGGLADPEDDVWVLPAASAIEYHEEDGETEPTEASLENVDLAADEALSDTIVSTPTAEESPSPGAPVASTAEATPELPPGTSHAFVGDDLDLEALPGWRAVVFEEDEVAAVALPGSVPEVVPQEVLHSLPEIRRFFRTNEKPIILVAPTPFGLAGLEHWVGGYSCVARFDPFEGRHPGVVAPASSALSGAATPLEWVNALLGDDAVTSHLRGQQGARAIFLAYDRDTERRAVALGLDLAVSPASLCRRVESRVEATRLAADAGVPTVPNVLGHAASWQELRLLARAKALGDDLVVQTAYADAGASTFAIASADDWVRAQDRLVGEQLRVMMRIRPREVIVAGTVTRHGTVVAPQLAEATGFPDLVPYGGGWCVSTATWLTTEQVELAIRYTRLIGERIRREGFVGCFEARLLVDEQTGDVFLDRLDPRFAAASALANVAAAAKGELPHALLHLLEFGDRPYSLDLGELGAEHAVVEEGEAWSVFLLEDTAGVVELITAAPSTGVWRLDDDAPSGVVLARTELGWQTVADANEAFYLRVAGPGDMRYPGASLGVLVTRGGLLDGDRRLSERALRWIRGLKKNFWTAPAPADARAPAPAPFRFRLP